MENQDAYDLYCYMTVSGNPEHASATATIEEVECACRNYLNPAPPQADNVFKNQNQKGD
ncbi:MAG: hypothetical protein KDD76_00630 [Rickettsiales bacterium]|nr:hypothetical protein [Rickettsiales bacterium]